MLAVAVTSDRARDDVARAASSSGLDIACINSARQIVLSGAREAISEARARFGSRCRLLDVSHGFHSSLMDPIVGRWASEVAALPFREPRTPMLSALSGRLLHAADEIEEDVRHGVRQTVRWDLVTAVANESGCRAVILGNGHTLTRLWGGRPSRRARPSLTTASGTQPMQPERSVVVTGGSRGIGRACVETLADAGWHVVVVFRRAADEAAQVVQAVEDRGGSASAMQTDVSSEADVRELFRKVRVEHPRLAGVVSNAGVTRDGLTPMMSLATWNTVVETNLTSSFLVARESMKAMRRTGGSLVFMSSVSGLRGQVGQANYAASKGAVNAMTRALAREGGACRTTGQRGRARLHGHGDGPSNAARGSRAARRRGTPPSDGATARSGIPRAVPPRRRRLVHHGQIISVDGGLTA